MKIILIGYRAAGKTTVGRLLGGKLKVPFLDTDQMIEESAGMPIRELVAGRGWTAFREMETAAIASLGNESPAVISTGGGAVLSAQNREALRRLGPLIYLKTPSADLIERLSRDEEGKQARPSLTGSGLAAETISVLEERIPVYEEAADFTVDTNGKNVVRVSDEIYQYLLETGIVFEINQKKKKLKKDNG